MAKIAPGAKTTVTPPAHVWDVKGKTQEEIMIETMKWKISLIADQTLPRHRLAHKFYKNVKKSA